MNSILLTLLIVLLLIGVVAISVAKGIARLMPWNMGAMQSPYYQSGYPQQYEHRKSSGSGHSVLAVFLIVALVATIYNSPFSDGPANLVKASIENGSATATQKSVHENPELSTTNDDYVTLAKLGVFEPVREPSTPITETPEPTQITYASGTQPVDDFYPRYAWQLASFGSNTLANEFALTIVSKYPDVRIYDAGTGVEGRYKVICSLSRTRQPVLDWSKKHINTKGFITQID